MRPAALMCALALALALPVALAQDATPVPEKKDVKKAPKKKVAKVAKPAGPPAKALFGAAKSPAPMAARAIGFYAKGCLAGAASLAVDGPAWQAMRLSRNRNWGHPELIALVEKLATDAKKHDGWPGLLVGDLSQPRGGPMLTGHASHQVGLDADIWLTPMPDRRLSAEGARGAVSHLHAGRRPGVGRSQGVDRRPRAPAEARGLLRRRRAHFRPPRHQEGAMRGGAQGRRSCVAAQGAGVLGPPLSFPRPHGLPQRQRQLRASACSAQRRWLRQGAHALAGAGQGATQARATGTAKARADHGPAAGGMRHGAVERAGRAEAATRCSSTSTRTKVRQKSAKAPANKAAGTK